MKNKRGITLITLVITIIVLLVLSGITLSLMLGENGVLQKAAISKTTHDRTKAEEQLKFVQNQYMTDSRAGNLNIDNEVQRENWFNVRKNNKEIDQWYYIPEDKIIGIFLDKNALYFYSDGNEIETERIAEVEEKLGISIPEYNITYELNGGTNEANPVETYRKGNTVQLPLPTKEGAQFLGWSMQRNNSENVITAITSNMEGDIKLYAYWLEETPKEYFNFTVNDGKATITGFSDLGRQKYNDGKIKNLVLPGSDNQENLVTIIGDGAFSACTEITSLIIPDTVTQIGTWSCGTFSNCTGIKYLKIPISTVVVMTNGGQSSNDKWRANTRIIFRSYKYRRSIF